MIVTTINLISWELDHSSEHVFNYGHVEEYLFFAMISVFLFAFMTRGKRRNWPFRVPRFCDLFHFHFLILPLVVYTSARLGRPPASMHLNALFPSAMRRSIQIRLRPRRKDFLFPQKLSRWQVIDRRLTCPAFGTNARSTRFLTVLVEHSTWSTGTRADNSEISFSVTGNFLKR